MIKLSSFAFSILLIQSCTIGMIIDRSSAKPLLQKIAITPHQSSNSVKLKSKIVRWHSGKKGSTEYREAIVRYPIVIGLQNLTVLRKVQTALSLKAIVGQSSLAEFQQDNWLTDLSYAINYNQNSILDLTYTISGMGVYPSTSKKWVSIDLISGNILQAKDLFKADDHTALAQLIDKIMQQEIQAEMIQLIRDIPDLKPQLPDMFTRHHFKPKDLNNFTIDKKGVTFHYNFDFVHALKAAEPSGAYFISYDKLSRYIHPDGVIGFALGQRK